MRSKIAKKIQNNTPQHVVDKVKEYSDNLINTNKKVMNKGMLNGTCNLSRCTTGKPATYYNHGSLSHYCEDCAKMLSEDPVNKQDAMIRFGHDLCTLVDQTETDPILEQGNKIYFKNYDIDNYLFDNLPYTTKKQQSQTAIPVRSEPKIYPNEPCVCGSGVKYKKCCKNK